MADQIIQGSPEWFAIRCGKVTASRVADVIARTKTGWGASRANYAAELVAERLTGVLAEGFKSAAMQWGSDNEADARAAYAWLRDAEVEEVGFVPHHSIADTGASPDGLVGPDGLVEIKCPSTATHIETLLDQSIPAKYITQMQWQMACTGAKWCDFVSYDPRMPEEMRLFVKRVERDQGRIEELEAEVVTFLAEVRATVAELTRIYRPAKPSDFLHPIMAG
jgi:putative phage-type endonuclease